jgi:hypothetical protein
VERKVFFAGRSGAGKTALLAAIFHFVQSNVQQKDEGYVNLKNDSLRMQYRWPERTPVDNSYRWSFTSTFPLLDDRSLFGDISLSFFDYSGLLLDNICDTSSLSYRDLRMAIVQADVIFGILDGDKIAALLARYKTSNIRKVDEFIYVDLPSLLQIMMLPNRIVTSHFIVTKFDLLQRVYDLDTIIDALLSIDEFKQFVISMGDDIPWIVPITASRERLTYFEMQNAVSRYGYCFSYIKHHIAKCINITPRENLRDPMNILNVIAFSLQPTSLFRKPQATGHKICQGAALSYTLPLPLRQKQAYN